MQKNKKRQKGVSFLEVLVAVVVLSVGFLATSRMQIMGMRYNQSAFFKSQASIMASNIADRMRANIAGVDEGRYDSVSTSSLPPDPGCMTSGCNSTQLASLDIRQWGQNIENILPNGSGSIDRLDSIFEIMVSWDEAVSGSTESQSVRVWLNP